MMEIRFSARSENEAFARVAVAAFISQLDPIMEELTDLKTVVSEAVTNAIIHGYEEDEGKMISLKTEIKGHEVTIVIADEGTGISNINKAREPLYTTKPEKERSGMGFTIMENFVDEIKIDSKEGQGTTITLVKTITTNEALCK